MQNICIISETPGGDMMYMYRKISEYLERVD